MLTVNNIFPESGTIIELCLVEVSPKKQVELTFSSLEYILVNISEFCVINPEIWPRLDKQLQQMHNTNAVYQVGLA